MPQTVQCPQCEQPNLRPQGAAGTYCQACGRYFQFEPQNFFDRLIDPFTSPKGIVIGSVALLFLFAAFWGLLHLTLSGPAKQTSAPPQVATNNNSNSADTSASPAVAPPPAVEVPVVSAPPPVVITPTPLPAVAGPTPQPLPSVPVVVSEKSVGEAIIHGTRYLISGFDPATHMIRGDANLVHGADAWLFTRCCNAMMRSAIQNSVQPRTSWRRQLTRSRASRSTGGLRLMDTRFEPMRWH